VLAFFERQALVREFTAKSATLHRLASQRADQHDAHLTALSAISVGAGTSRQDLFLEVAATISRFYPRIVSANLVPLHHAEGGIQILTGLEQDAVALVRKLADQSTGSLELAQMPQVPGRYLLVKRSPNNDDAQLAIALAIDAEGLVNSDDLFWANPSVSLRLLTPGGFSLIGGPTPNGVAFSKPLGSASQPLVFESSITLGPSDILSLGRTLAVIGIFTAVYVVILLGLRQRARTKEAEGLALLSAQKARLAHATRINAMGEMASGMAHELAQPLTAILSQSQASRRLIELGDTDRLLIALSDTVSQAQRASDILERLRRWSKPNRTDVKSCDLNNAVRGVRQLAASDVKSAGGAVQLQLSSEPVFIDADPVELEQVIFNLVRNALEASDAPKITIKTHATGTYASLEVSDDGPGIPNDLKSRIFDPFVTGRPEGTGLGLALCQRLVEEMEGNLTLLDNTTETTFRLTLPLSAKRGIA